MADLTISVILPVLNGLPWLSEQLDALARQDFDKTRWEVVVVDNGCTDESMEYAFDYASALPGLSVVDASDRQSLSYARNVGAQVAQGTHVMFCDADDIVDRHWLSRAAEAFEVGPYIGGNLRVSLINPRRLALQRPSPTATGLPEAFGLFTYAVGANCGVSRELYLEIGGCDERFTVCGDDVDLGWRLKQRGISPVWAPSMIVDYRLRRTIRALWQQQRRYGEAQVLFNVVHDRHHHDFPQAAHEWLTMVTRSYMLLRGPTAQGQYLRAAASRYGKARASVKHGVLDL